MIDDGCAKVLMTRREPKRELFLSIRLCHCEKCERKDTNQGGWFLRREHVCPAVRKAAVCLSET